MKTFEVSVDDESAELLNNLLRSLSYVKEVRHLVEVDPNTFVSEETLKAEWLVEEDDELQTLYNK